MRAGLATLVGTCALVALVSSSRAAQAEAKKRRCKCPPPSGLYVGVDAGEALRLASALDPVGGAPSFGVRAGYLFRSGLALDLRADDLGLEDAAGVLRAGGLGLRYTLPGPVRPFAEVHAGAAGYVGFVLAAECGAGLAVPVGRHVLLEWAARDWIADLDGSVRHVPAFTAGLTVGF